MPGGGGVGERAEVNVAAYVNCSYASAYELPSAGAPGKGAGVENVNQIKARNTTLWLAE